MRHPNLLAALLLLLLCSACASERDRIAEVEQMLAAAGFTMEQADTPGRQAQLASLPPHQVMVQQIEAGGTPKTAYVYADPDLCHCLYIGDQRSFQAFQQLAMQKRIADEHLQAAQMEEMARLDWDMWAPPVWPAPIIVVHEHEGRRGAR
jgi:hypothetical protein